MIAAAVVVFGVLVALNRGDDGDDVFALPPLPAGIAQNGKTLGDPGAPVTLVDFSDFLCPHCQDFVGATERLIVEKYVASGRVKIEYKHYLVFGPPSLQAATAAECAAEQNRFWQYHDALFSHQAEAKGGGFASARLIELAGDSGLDVDAFKACLPRLDPMSAVQSDIDDGRRRGVTGTPTFFVGDEMIGGNDGKGVIDAIERALAG